MLQGNLELNSSTCVTKSALGGYYLNTDFVLILVTTYLFHKISYQRYVRVVFLAALFYVFHHRYHTASSQ